MVSFNFSPSRLTLPEILLIANPLARISLAGLILVSAGVTFVPVALWAQNVLKDEAAATSEAAARDEADLAVPADSADQASAPELELTLVYDLVTNPGVAATSDQDAHFVRCISKKFELYVDLSHSDLNHHLLNQVEFGIRSGIGAFKKERAVVATIRQQGEDSTLDFVGTRGTHVQISTASFIMGEAIVRDWDLGCDFYQNHIFAQNSDWTGAPAQASAQLH